ncbi:MAG: AIM24 family protein [Caldilineaceae bacterium]
MDTGHVAMFEPTVDFDIELQRGFKNILLGGEGLFLASLRDPGRVYLQSMPRRQKK